MRKISMLVVAAALFSTAANAQVCTTFRNQMTCTDGTTVNRYGNGTIEVQRPAVPVPGPRNGNLYIYRSQCLQRNGQYGYCDEQGDD